MDLVGKEMQMKISKLVGQSMLKFKCRSCFARVHHAVKQLQKSFLYFLNPESAKKINPDEVNPREGHFLVLTIGSDEAKKFFVALSFLAYPRFVKLLEAAKQESGFDQPGILVILCEAKELQRILFKK